MLRSIGKVLRMSQRKIRIYFPRMLCLNNMTRKYVYKYNQHEKTTDLLIYQRLGSLTVESLNIGVWSFSVDGEGNFNVEAATGSGGMILHAPLQVSTY